MSRRKVDGKYELLGKLGGGAMGQVYRGTDTSLDRPVAVKFLNPAIAENSKARERFRDEGRALAQLKHDNVATIYAAGVENEQPYMVMEFIEGTTLETVLRERPLPLEVAVPILFEILDGLGHAHSKGIYHRDVKPSNVILTADGHAKVIDFGIAHVEDSERKTVAGDILCTPAYASPEQAGTLKKGEKIDGRSDIYSIGTIFFEMLTGRPPIERESTPATLLAHATEDAPHLPEKFNPAIVAAVDRALARERDRRFRTTDEFKAALNSAIPDATVAVRIVAAHLSTLSRPVPPPTIMDLAPRRKRRISWMIYASGGVLLVALAIGFWMLKALGESSEPLPPPVIEIHTPPPPKDWDIVPLPRPDPQPLPVLSKVPKAPKPPTMSADERAELDKRRVDLEIELKKQSARLATLRSLGENPDEQTRLEKLCGDLKDQLDSIEKRLAVR